MMLLKNRELKYSIVHPTKNIKHTYLIYNAPVLNMSAHTMITSLLMNVSGNPNAKKIMNLRSSQRTVPLQSAMEIILISDSDKATKRAGENVEVNKHEMIK